MSVTYPDLRFCPIDCGGITVVPFEWRGDPPAGETVQHHKHPELIADYTSVFAHSLYHGCKSLLEIGVKHGGSVLFWQRVLECDVVGLDVNLGQVPENARSAIQRNPRTEIVSMDGASAPAADLARSRKVDLIIDDGAHTIDTIPRSLEILWPALRPGGLYVVEDWIALSHEHRMKFLGGVVERFVGSWTERRPPDGQPACIVICRYLIAFFKPCEPAK